MTCSNERRGERKNLDTAKGDLRLGVQEIFVGAKPINYRTPGTYIFARIPRATCAAQVTSLQSPFVIPSVSVDLETYLTVGDIVVVVIVVSSVADTQCALLNGAHGMAGEIVTFE